MSCLPYYEHIVAMIYIYLIIMLICFIYYFNKVFSIKNKNFISKDIEDQWLNVILAFIFFELLAIPLLIIMIYPIYLK